MKTVSDEQLIRWVAAGDSSCLATLFERHHRSVYRFFMQMLHDPSQSEDLVQDVFLKMLRKAGSFRGSGSFKGWMFNLARNAALDQLRRTHRQRTDTIGDGSVDEHIADQRSAEQAATGSQKVSLVLRALARLPAAAQEVIWLGRFEFDNYAELGQALDCNAAAARVRMHRAMAQLNSTYTDLYGVPVDG